MMRLLVGLVIALLSPALAAGAGAGKHAASSAAAAPARAIVDHVAWEKVDGRGRLVVGVKGAVDYTTHAAGAVAASNLPDRAYVDLHPAVLGKDVARAPRPIEDAVAARLRVGQFDAETVRIVIDLREPALFEVRTSDHPPRLLLGLAPRAGAGAVASREASAASTARAAAPAPPEEVARASREPATPGATHTPARTAEPTAAPTAVPATASPARAAAAQKPAPAAVAQVPSGAAAAGGRHATVAPGEPPAPARQAAEAGAARPAPAEPRRTAPARDRDKLARAPRPQASPRLRTVVIDPGHGGKDPGARGVTGDEEKDITLLLAKMVAEQLAADPQIRVVLTRTDDSYVSLEQRTAIANAQGADLFLSIHANASEDPELAGIETYTLNNTDDRATIRLAALENGLTLTGAAPGERDLAYILSDLVQTGKEDESVSLARAVQGSLVSYLRDRWRGVTNLGVKKGPFYVLVGAYMPCVLVEVAFLTNETEGQRIAARRYQLDVADGIAQGVRRFLASDTANANL